MTKSFGTADYEASEGIAIDAGKAALQEDPRLFNRVVAKSRGSFATLIQNDNVHPEHYSVRCTDGVGSKVILAANSGNFTPQSIDGVMMVVNDMATLMNARPDAIDIYISTQKGVREKHMGQIMEGIRIGLEQSFNRFCEYNVNIGKIETASLEKLVSTGVPGLGYDLSLSLSGFIKKNQVPELDPKPGYKIIGVASTGLHSNGFTMACESVFSPEIEYREEWKPCYRGKHMPGDKPELLSGKTVLEALQAPTACYFPIAMEIGSKISSRYIYGVNITGNGLGNFNRVGRNVSFEITDPLPLLPVHKFVIQEAGLSPRDAYEKLNCGMGFGFIAPDYLSDAIVDEINMTTGLNGRFIAKIVGEVHKNKSRTLRTTIHKPFEGRKITYRGYNC